MTVLLLQLLLSEIENGRCVSLSRLLLSFERLPLWNTHQDWPRPCCWGLTDNNARQQSLDSKVTHTPGKANRPPPIQSCIASTPTAPRGGGGVSQPAEAKQCRFRHLPSSTSSQVTHNVTLSKESFYSRHKTGRGGVNLLGRTFFLLITRERKRGKGWRHFLKCLLVSPRLLRMRASKILICWLVLVKKAAWMKCSLLPWAKSIWRMGEIYLVTVCRSYFSTWFLFSSEPRI